MSAWYTSLHALADPSALPGELGDRYTELLEAETALKDLPGYGTIANGVLTQAKNDKDNVIFDVFGKQYPYGQLPKTKVTRQLAQSYVQVGSSVPGVDVWPLNGSLDPANCEPRGFV
jgi:hypothetical protein